MCSIVLTAATGLFRLRFMVGSVDFNTGEIAPLLSLLDDAYRSRLSPTVSTFDHKKGNLYAGKFDWAYTYDGFIASANVFTKKQTDIVVSVTVAMMTVDSDEEVLYVHPYNDVTVLKIPTNGGAAQNIPIPVAINSTTVSTLDDINNIYYYITYSLIEVEATTIHSVFLNNSTSISHELVEFYYNYYAGNEIIYLCQDPANARLLYGVLRVGAASDSTTFLLLSIDPSSGKFSEALLPNFSPYIPGYMTFSPVSSTFYYGYRVPYEASAVLCYYTLPPTPTSKSTCIETNNQIVNLEVAYD
eukprot:TRINITY_DN13816_c0_g1_i1.p1 TRINITY_DN13816_c0_g1~~TRINITY_DN13816_c0_g1_i1.p1  ORF type:complete len:301 (-),score=38.22 TRINITY_DN13816_c0_g1_i1:66-968(-)